MPVLTERQESFALASWLRLHNVLFLHVPNEGLGRTWQQGFTLKRMGMSKGAPDYVIFDRGSSKYRGVAIELKRTIKSTTSPEQLRWLENLREHGWYAIVCFGADHAITELQKLGIGNAG